MPKTTAITPDASTTVKGKIKLAGALGGTADLPTTVMGNSTTATVATSQTTTSTSYTDLATAGPAVTVTTGTLALVIISARQENNTAGQWCYMSFAVSGATTTAAADANGLQNSNSVTALNQIHASRAVLVTLTPGSNTFTSKYRVTAGTGTWVTRDIIVIPLN